MSARVELTVALGVAALLHVALFSLTPETAGAEASGAGGNDSVSIMAGSDAIAAMVAEWEVVPETADVPDMQMPDAPEVSMSEPVITPPETVEAPRTAALAPPMPLMMPEAPALPDPAVTELPAPPAETKPEKTEPVPAQRPQPKPAAAPKPAPKAPPKEAVRTAEPKTRAAPPPGGAGARAAGAGGGTAAGVNGAAEASIAGGKALDAKANWGANIRARIERRKSYPRAAAGAQGVVTVRLTVARGGALSGLALVKSSGNPVLDEAALKAVRAAGKFPAAPKSLPGESFTFTLPMSFTR
jgi:periplasmic protein TonB